jgi:hypothetical protein
MGWTRSISYRTIGAALAVASAACTGLSDEPHPCPCSSQTTCCESSNLCVPLGGTCPASEGGTTDAPQGDLCSGAQDLALGDSVHGTTCGGASGHSAPCGNNPVMFVYVNAPDGSTFELTASPGVQLLAYATCESDLPEECTAGGASTLQPSDARWRVFGVERFDTNCGEFTISSEATACPAQQPSGPCSGSPSCAYGCTSCQCTGGVWSCMEPSCPAVSAVCLGLVPNEGEPCVRAGGACCNPGIGVGSTCPFTCGGETGSATCELAPDASEATWHLSRPCSGSLDGGDAGSSYGGDAATVDGVDGATADSSVDGGNARATDAADSGG